MNRQLRMGGGIMDVVPRDKFFLGKVARAAKKVVKKATGAVKDIASSDLGKAALLYGATAGLGSIGSGQTGLARFAPSNFMGNLGRIGSFISGGTLMDDPTGLYAEGQIPGKKNIFQKALSAVGIGDGKMGNIGKLATLTAVSGFLTNTLGMTPEQAEEELARDPSGYLEQYYRNLNPPTADTNSEQYEQQVRDFVTANTSEYAVGGRVGFADGPVLPPDPSALGGVMSLPEASIEFYDYFKDMSMKPEFIMPEGSDKRDDLREVMLFKDNDMAKAEQLIDEQGLDKLYEEAVEIVRENDEANEYFLSLVNNKDLDISPADAYYSVIKKFGRVSRAEGDPLPPDPTTPVNPFKPKPIGPVLPNKMMASDDTNERVLEALFEKYLDMGLSPKDAADKAREEFERMGKRRIEETRGLAALGGKMDTASDNAMQAAGVEGLPIRQNPKGVKELDLRETGGFIQPVGIKEKEDDIPAMLSNNEFVFTADAVRGAGGGNVNVGAQRMYDMMKKLEAGGRV
jgi:hypothetical protein